MADPHPKPDPFPAPSRHATGTINSITTEATCIHFTDKILITLTQEGRLSQWIQVPLSSPSLSHIDLPPGPPVQSGNLSALPALHLTPKTLLGAGNDGRETMGQLYAAQIASHLSLKDPEDRRTVVLGLGLVMGKDGVVDGGDTEERRREAMFDVLELVVKVL